MSEQALNRDFDAGTSTGLPAPWSEFEFRRLLEKLPAGAYMCDPTGLITYYNRRAVDLWGRTPKLNDPEDRFCGSFRLFTPDGSTVRHDRCWMALAIADDTEYDGQEIVIERPDGERITVLAHANPVHDHNGVQIGAVNVLVDISERKQAEDVLRAADRSKNEFLAMLAHELRNPLAPIRNAVRILSLQSSEAPESKRAVEIIDRQMQQMTRLIDDLMDVSRITQNRLELRKRQVELADVVRSAVEISRPLVEARHHTFTIDVPTDPIHLHADPARLAQALSNLLNNAAKYSEPEGEITLAAALEDDEAVITVCDSGIGIPRDMLPHVFDMFMQAGGHGHGCNDGLGIGLTLVKRLIEMHGGTVSATSEGTGRGSEFTIRLPVSADPS